MDVMFGSSASFYCRAANPSSVFYSWSVFTCGMETTTDSYHFTTCGTANNTAVMEFKPLAPPACTVLMCKASKMSAPCTLFSKSYTAQVGRKFSLTCQTNGSQARRVAWILVDVYGFSAVLQDVTKEELRVFKS
ncbi:hypothetical protein RRG08_042405 [Elysia crispata]|uniref:Uncharacterized protein n=1 Tax=Elysia crispata TaxID=231223 RepID=A0AAE0ZCZ6_9GAST|nr:hypothetical protein RRG08_042405 [Elysia crispata]